jgi:hypothetical protein
MMIITLAILWLGAIIHPQLPSLVIYETRPMPLYGLLKQLCGTGRMNGLFVTFPLVCLMLFLITNFNTTEFFINERTFLPALFYTLFSGFFPSYQVLNPVLPASLFLMLAFRRIINSYRNPGIAYNYFDAGVLIGVGTLFYADLVWLGILLIAGILLFRSISFSEFVLSIIGVATPFIITVGLYYVLGRDIMLFIDDIRDNLFEKVSSVQFTRLTVILLIYSGLLMVLASGFLLLRMYSKKIKSRKIFSLLLWALLLAAVIFAFVPSVSTEVIWIAAVPASYILAHYFVFERKKVFAEVVFSLFFVIVLLVQAFYLF